MVLRPRSARKQSNGARAVPSALATKYSRSLRSSRSTQTTPAIVSEWPQTNFVAECTTMSAPSANGFCSSGDMSVLSTSINAPCFLQTRARPRRSQTRCMGFVGDSTMTSATRGVMASSSRRGPWGPSMATNLTVTPASRAARASSRYVPPYESSLSNTSSPFLQSRTTAASAAMPVEYARQCFAPSASAMAFCSAVRVGFPDRV
mmetsp:Transcript_8474/g.26489  ORF Transcript_8474/g.26489 Transcript_8474/m.26489 type:complete len:205 (-) Transcript_8474:439-1053(-)